MYIVAQHRITDPDKFFSYSAEEVAENAPAGVQARQFFPSGDRTSATCLWEAESVDQVRDYIDGMTEGIAENSYYEVDSSLAMGLPEAARASA